MKLLKSLLFLLALIIWKHRGNSGDASKRNGDNHYQPIQPSAEDREHRENERAYWKKQISVGEAFNWITGITALVGIIGLIALWLQADAARKTAQTALDQLHLSQRPWITIRQIIIDPPLTFHPDETWEVGLRMKIVNVGNSPAEVGYIVSHIVFTNDLEVARTKQRDTCKSGTAFGSGTLVPHDERITPLFAPRFPKNETIDYTATTIQMWFVGCIRYGDQFGTWRSTPIFYQFNPMDKPISIKSQGIIAGDFEEFPFPDFSSSNKRR